jgi:hypothetical protein
MDVAYPTDTWTVATTVSLGVWMLFCLVAAMRA